MLADQIVSRVSIHKLASSCCATPLRSGGRACRAPASRSCVRRLLRVWNAGDGALLGTYGWPRERFNHLLGSVRICDPILVEIVRACRHTFVAFVGIDLARVTAM